MNENIQNLVNRIKVYYMSAQSFEEMSSLPALVPFDERVIDFLSELSSAIRKDPEAKANPVIQTFAFFIRRSNLLQLKERHDTKGRIGKGLSLHIAPSNVPINFAYSMVSGLLAGNPCIVRASSKDFEETKIICRLIESLSKKDEIDKGDLTDQKYENAVNNVTDHKDAYDQNDVYDRNNINKQNETYANNGLNDIYPINKYVSVISYAHDKEITDYLSSLVNVRVIWGGDNTISEIRKSPIRPRCTEVCFADRYSMLMIDASYLISRSADDSYMEQTAKMFYNDTYLFDQNACGSPRLIYWYGNEADIEKAKKIFWDAVHTSLIGRYDIQPVIAVDKTTMTYKASAEIPGCKIVPTEDNIITRVMIADLTKLPEGKSLADFEAPGGFFFEYDSGSLEALKAIVDERFQTLTYICQDAVSDVDGRNSVSGAFSKDSEEDNDKVVANKSDIDVLTRAEIINFITTNGLKGIDRVVPIGHSADFDLVWDGYDLINYYTRVIG